MKNLLLAVLAGTTVLFAVLWANGQKAHEQARDRAKANQTQIDEQARQLDAQRQTIELLNHQQQEMQSGIGRLYAQLQAARTNSNPGTSVDRTATSQPAQSGNSGQGLGTFMNQLMENPETKKAMEQQQRLSLEMAYRPLLKELNLPASEAEQFLSLLANRGTRGLDNVAALMGKDPAQRRAAIEVMTDTQRELDLSLRALLGEERFAKYSEFTETIGERTALTQFTSMNAVTEDQTKLLLQAIREEKKRSMAEAGPTSQADRQARELEAMATEAGMDRLVQQQELLNARVLDRAKTILSPEQVATYGAFQTNQLEFQKVGLKMARTMFAPPANGESKTP